MCILSHRLNARASPIFKLNSKREKALALRSSAYRIGGRPVKRKMGTGKPEKKLCERNVSVQTITWQHAGDRTGMGAMINTIQPLEVR